MRHEIRIRGHLSKRRVRCFEGLTVTHEPGGDTLLVGQLQDQSEVHGLLSWLQDMGVTLISYRQLEDGTAAEGDSRP